MFNYSGERLTHRIRCMAFRSMITKVTSNTYDIFLLSFLKSVTTSYVYMNEDCNFIRVYSRRIDRLNDLYFSCMSY